MKIDQIQQQVGRGEYEVDNRAVADAILRRILGAPVRGHQHRDDDGPQTPEA